MPDTSLTEFTGITFTNISAEDETPSGHATGVAKIFYGHSTSLITAIETVYIDGTTHFFNEFLLTSPVSTSSVKTVNHSYIGAADPDQVDTYNEAIKRFDFFSQDSNLLNVIAMNNGSSLTIPPFWGSAYNTVSVGRTDGQHSHGSTHADYIGPGRQKPDIVAPLTVTSNATPAVSSAATLLYAKGELSSNIDATHADTVKACLLAGATKSEFSNWSQTSAKPLDITFGAGELNIFHSYRIIEKAESAPGTVNFRGWSRNTTSSSTSRTYTFTTPDYRSPSLSSALIWQRDVTQSGSFYNRSYTYQDLANLKLELLDSSGTPIQTSDSALDNVEHIWNTTLTPNTTYQLRVSSASSTTNNFSLAWRVDGTPLGKVACNVNESDVALNFSELYPDILYTIQKSADLTTWSDEATFTPTTSTSSWTDAGAYSSTTPTFYRLRFFAP